MYLKIISKTENICEATTINASNSPHDVPFHVDNFIIEMRTTFQDPWKYVSTLATSHLDGVYILS